MELFFPAKSRAGSGGPRRRAQGFTLIELLIVVAIMAMLGGLATPALMKSYRSSSLTQAGNRLTDVAMLARQNALSRNTMTAVVMVTSTSAQLAGISHDALTVIELSPSQGGWNQITGWTFLPSQAKAYANLAALSPADLPLPVGGTLPVLRLPSNAGAPVTLAETDYVCYVFNPDGTMYNVSSPLPQAYVQYASDQAPSGGVQAANLHNYYDLVFSDAGGINIVRP